MFMYRVEAELEDKSVALVVIAESDAAAFAHAEVTLEKYYIAPPKVRSMAVIEKKRIEKGAGYVIELNPE
ncbi:DUF3906 family protein [Paenibacillus thermoaerophilus]|uniref:DUF3906 family protein n=1 Tax=Paenibacillus thermoaerophilus TaxID=1215385 RepID=A0ABW2V802_9BACL|nr:DUF3906 family protein [Paenibacillus thermoaerophilus]TMV17854.1 DUF3906 family protein [Paenibacillus thermoaerophilus]